MKHRNLWVLLFLTLSLVYAAAQDNGPCPMPNGRQSNAPGSLNFLSGSVHSADGHPVRDARVEVHALGSGQVVASAYTMPNGGFEFSNLPRGLYEVVVASGIQQVRERVELFQSDLRVQLVLPTQAADADPLSANSTVSVAQFKVPDKARKLYQKAQQAFQKQKFAQAQEHVEKALQIFPNYAQALTLRGLLKLQDDKAQDACTDLETAIKADYGYAMGYIVLGAAYNFLQRYDDSIRVLGRGIGLQPSSWQAYFEMSKALLGKGEYDAALRQVNKAAELAPANYSPIHLVRAHALLGIKDYTQAVGELEQFLGANPNGPDSARVRDTLNQVRAFMASNGK